MNLVNRRTSTSDQGTFGQIVLPSGLMLYSLTLPWRDNAIGKSCLKAGFYRLSWEWSDRFNMPVYRFHDQDTFPRKAVEIHPGNFAGDTDKGWCSDVTGCTVLGMEIGSMLNPHGHLQRAVQRSRQAVDRLSAEMKQEPFILEIESIVPGVEP